MSLVVLPAALPHTLSAEPSANATPFVLCAASFIWHQPAPEPAHPPFFPPTLATIGRRSLYYVSRLRIKERFPPFNCPLRPLKVATLKHTRCWGYRHRNVLHHPSASARLSAADTMQYVAGASHGYGLPCKPFNGQEEPDSRAYAGDRMYWSYYR